MEHGGIIRCKQQDLMSEEIKNHLANDKLVTKLALNWGETLSFVLGMISPSSASSSAKSCASRTTTSPVKIPPLAWTPTSPWSPPSSPSSSRPCLPPWVVKSSPSKQIGSA